MVFFFIQQKYTIPSFYTKKIVSIYLSYLYWEFPLGFDYITRTVTGHNLLTWFSMEHRIHNNFFQRFYFDDIYLMSNIWCNRK